MKRNQNKSKKIQKWTKVITNIHNLNLCSKPSRLPPRKTHAKHKQSKANTITTQKEKHHPQLHLHRYQSVNQIHVHINNATPPICPGKQTINFRRQIHKFSKHKLNKITTTKSQYLLIKPYIRAWTYIFFTTG